MNTTMQNISQISILVAMLTLWISQRHTENRLELIEQKLRIKIGTDPKA